MNQAGIVRRAYRRTSLQHKRDRTRRIKRSFMSDEVAQRAAIQQFHDDVEITVVGRTKVRYRRRVRVLHATGSARFAAKALLRSLITVESLTENFERNRPVDEQVSCFI